MGKLLRNVCCLMLVFLLFIGLSQMSMAASLMDEGTEGNASEYSSPSGFGGTVMDETEVKQVGTYSLKMYADFRDTLTTVKIRELSQAVTWGDFEKAEVQIYKNDETVGDMHLKLLARNSPYAAGVVWDIALSSQAIDTWVTYTFSKDAARQSAYGAVGSSDEIKYMLWYWHTNDNFPGDWVCIDGFNINPATAAGGGLCLGTLAVGVFTVIALVAVGVKSKKEP